MELFLLTFGFHSTTTNKIRFFLPNLSFFNLYFNQFLLMHIIEDTNGRDPQLWELAKKRAGFKNHLYTYLLVNAFLWILYFITNDGDNNYWPIWTTLGWGVGLAFNYVNAYVRPINSAEAEYEKLKNKS
jgi:2TM domain